MNFEVDLFFNSLISSLSQIQSILKKFKSQVSSTIWAHYYIARDNKDSDSKLRYYAYCTINLIYCTYISFNMRKHLQRKYKINIKISVN